MVKLQVCDICKKDGKYVECTRYYRVSKRPDLRLDYCSNCFGKIPSGKGNFRQYVQYVKFIKEGITMSEEELTEFLKKRY
jgi:hypothetical protein